VEVAGSTLVRADDFQKAVFAARFATAINPASALTTGISIQRLSDRKAITVAASDGKVACITWVKPSRLGCAFSLVAESGPLCAAVAPPEHTRWTTESLTLESSDSVFLAVGVGAEGQACPVIARGGRVCPDLEWLIKIPLQARNAPAVPAPRAALVAALAKANIEDDETVVLTLIAGEFTLSSTTGTCYTCEHVSYAGPPIAVRVSSMLLHRGLEATRYEIPLRGGLSTSAADIAREADTVMLRFVGATHPLVIGNTAANPHYVVLPAALKTDQSTPGFVRTRPGRQASADSHEELAEALSELSHMVGMDAVRRQIQRVTNVVKVQQARQAAGFEVPTISHHLAFVGPPGTGKTSVARLMSKIYRGLGVLEKGQLVEVARQDLVGGHVGETALKTDAAIDSAIGGSCLSTRHTLSVERTHRKISVAKRLKHC